jgi:hypothetical protein
VIIRTEGFLGQAMSLPAPPMPSFTGGVFLCPNGYWSFALTLPNHQAFGAFFDSAFAAEDELLRQYPEGVEPFYFSDCMPSPRLAIRDIVVAFFWGIFPILWRSVGLLACYVALQLILPLCSIDASLADAFFLTGASLGCAAFVVYVFGQAIK